MQSKEKAFDNFDAFATDYRQIHNENIKITGADSEYFARYKIEIVAKLPGIEQVQHILDFGCGDGISLKFFNELLPNRALAGIDVSEESIAEAKKRNLSNATLKSFDGFHVPFDDNTFDLVFVANVYHHIDHSKHQQVSAEILRVLKPGCRFVMFEHNPYNPVTQKIVKDCVFDADAVLLPPGYTKRMLRTSGFKDVSIYYTLFFPRNKIFKPLLPLEPLLHFIPIGGQYYTVATKPE